MKLKKSLCFVFILTACISIICPCKANGITIQEEEKMGREFMKVVLKHFEIIKEPVITDYVNNVGQKIVSVVASTHFRYRFYVIKQDVYNAFASPAGNIFINSGLLEAMENEEELAGILAHEIAHVECRHISQRIEKASKIGMATLAGIAAGILLGIHGSGTAANALTVGSIAAGQSMFLAYSREDEIQADQIGFNLLTKAGYSGVGLLSMLKKIRGKQWFSSDQIPTYLTTHPASEERIVYIGSLLQSSANLHLSKNQTQFEKAHTALIVTYGNEDSTLRNFKSLLEQHPENPLAHYKYGLILAKTGNRKEAIRHIKIALEKRPFDAYILKDLGRIYFLDGMYNEALQFLKNAVNIESNKTAFLFLGRTYLELGNFQEALSIFKNLTKRNPKYNEAMYFLAETHGKLKNIGDAHYCLGIYHKNKGNIKNAIFHLKRALSKTTNSEKKLEIKKILKQIDKKGTFTK